MRKTLPIVTSLVILSSSILVFANSRASDCIDWWQTDFEHEYLEDGYCDVYEYWVPGLISYRTWMTATPIYSEGGFTWYADGVMQDQLDARDIDLSSTGHIGAIALQTCADIGKTVWLKPPGMDWEGPYLVVDCARREHMFTQVVYGSSIGEVSFDTALRWGMIYYDEDQLLRVNWYRLDSVELYIGDTLSPVGEPIDYRDWWISNSLFVMDNLYLSYGEIWEQNPDPRD